MKTAGDLFTAAQGGGGGSVDRLNPDWFTGFSKCSLIGQINYFGLCRRFPTSTTCSPLLKTTMDDKGHQGWTAFSFRVRRLTSGLDTI